MLMYYICSFSHLACGDYSWIRCMRVWPWRCSSSQIKVLCPRSCRVCTGPKSELCANLPNTRGDANCHSLGLKGRCRETNYWLRFRMKTGCSKVCCQREELQNNYYG